MPFTDMPLSELERFRPEVEEPVDFDVFWAQALAESRAAGWFADLGPADTPLTELVIEDLAFSGFGGEPIKAWVARPKGRDGEKLPVVVQFNGYNGGRGVPGERVLWPLAGYAHVFMDTRGQGSGWGTGGDTPDPHGSHAAGSGWMTRGILDPREHYYRRVYADAALLVEHVAAFDFVDETRIAVTGESQGGGIAIAAAGLSPLVAAAMPDVAFLAAWRHGTAVALSDPYQELARYLAVHRDHVAAVWANAAYFDGVNFAKRITQPALFSVALMDEVVPPSTTFAAFNALASVDREIAVYPYNGHEGGQTFHWVRQTEWLAKRFA